MMSSSEKRNVQMWMLVVFSFTALTLKPRHNQGEKEELTDGQAGEREYTDTC